MFPSRTSDCLSGSGMLTLQKKKNKRGRGKSPEGLPISVVCYYHGRFQASNITPQNVSWERGAQSVLKNSMPLILHTNCSRNMRIHPQLSPLSMPLSYIQGTCPSPQHHCPRFSLFLPLFSVLPSISQNNLLKPRSE